MMAFVRALAAWLSLSGALASHPPGLTALGRAATPSTYFAAIRRSAFVGPAVLGRVGGMGDDPQQVHLSPGPVPGASMRVTWVTYVLANASVGVTWWPADGGAPRTAAAETSTYTAGEGGWGGWLYTAIMAPLDHGVTYAYTVGGGGHDTDARSFALPPAVAPDAALRVAVTADMGTIVPMGWAVADRLAQDHLEGPARFHAVLLAGDLSYATVSPGSCSANNTGCDELEWTWDGFGLQIEPFAATAPFLTAVGNHEHVPGNFTPAPGAPPVASAFAAYSARYRMPSDAPSGGSDGFWWSVEMGPAHLTFMSTEHAFSPTSAQHAWAAADFASVNRSRTPWLLVVLHRPVLSAAVLEWEDHSPGAKLSAALEPLFRDARVDVVVTGHIHSHERTHAVFNGTVITLPSGPDNATYVDPAAPIYVCSGASGALPENVFFDPAPAWSAARVLGTYGYSRLALATEGRVRTLRWDFVDVFGELVDAWGINKTVAVS